jgi:hypothetical protein
LELELATKDQEISGKLLEKDEVITELRQSVADLKNSLAEEK